MRKLVISAFAVAVVVSSAPAFAGEARWTDRDYLSANRCLGLAEASALGEVSSGDLSARIKSQGFGRNAIITDRGATLKIEATRQAKTKDEGRKAQLLAERDGVCKTFFDGSVAASGSVAPS